MKRESWIRFIFFVLLVVLAKFYPETLVGIPVFFGAIPSKIVGAGNGSTAQNVLRVVFSEASSDTPMLESWDDENFNTVANEVFAGTTGNSNKPMLSAVATKEAAPASNWMPANGSSGDSNVINRLKGDTFRVRLLSTSVAQNGDVLFNMVLELPYDASVPADLDNVLIVRYAYAGDAPVLSWYFNDDSAGGSEGTPQWTAITSGLTGNVLQPSDAGGLGQVIHKPTSSVAVNPELWVLAS
jgi:hypothetical protein